MPYLFVSEAKHPNSFVPLFKLRTPAPHSHSLLRWGSRPRRGYFEEPRFTFKENRPRLIRAWAAVPKSAFEINLCLGAGQPTTDGGKTKCGMASMVVIHSDRDLCIVSGGAMYLAEENSHGYLGPHPCLYTQTQNYILYTKFPLGNCHRT